MDGVKDERFCYHVVSSRDEPKRTSPKNKK
nr:MAG TPA: hypothetical protein [Caudoviricetes sp.]